jgi:hypothetical protein
MLGDNDVQSEKRIIRPTLPCFINVPPPVRHQKTYYIQICNISYSNLRICDLTLRSESVNCPLRMEECKVSNIKKKFKNKSMPTNFDVFQMCAKYFPSRVSVLDAS